MGTRKLGVWLRQPLINREEIKKRHDIVELLSQRQSILQIAQSKLKYVQDVDRIVGRFHKTLSEASKSNAGSGGANLNDLYNTWLCIQSCCTLVESLEQEVYLQDDGLSDRLRQLITNPLR